MQTNITCTHVRLYYDPLQNMTEHCLYLRVNSDNKWPICFLDGVISLLLATINTNFIQVATEKDVFHGIKSCMHTSIFSTIMLVGQIINNLKGNGKAGNWKQNWKCSSSKIACVCCWLPFLGIPEFYPPAVFDRLLC